MVRVKLEASAKFRLKIHSQAYTTTKEDLPPEEALLPGYPNVGDDISDSVSGRAWIVVRISWLIGQEMPIIVVE